MPYKTKDYNEVSTLLALKFRLVSVRRDGAVFFSFEPEDKARELMEAFWRGDLKLNLRDFINSQRQTKDMIFRCERENGGKE